MNIQPLTFHFQPLCPAATTLISEKPPAALREAFIHLATYGTKAFLGTKSAKSDASLKSTNPA